VNEFPNTRYLFHTENTGRGGSFLDGAKISRGKYIGFLDIDLEVSCIYLLDVLKELNNGADVVTVKRHYAIQLTPSFILRHILSLGYKYMVTKYFNIPKMDTETGFKFFKRACLFHVTELIQNKRWFFDSEAMVYSFLCGYEIQEIDGLFLRRKDKTSTVNVFSDTMDYLVEVRRFKKRLTAEYLKNRQTFLPKFSEEEYIPDEKTTLQEQRAEEYLQSAKKHSPGFIFEAL